MEEVRNPLVAGQFEPLGIDHEELDLIRRRLEEDAADHGVERDALPRTGRSGDQEMGHADQIGDDGSADDVFPEGDGQPAGRFPECGVVEDVPQTDRFPFLVGDLDADGPLARDGGDDPDARRPQRERQVVREIGDLVDLDAGGGFELVHGDDRTGLDLHHLPLDAEIGELLLEGPGIGDEVLPFDPGVLSFHAVEQGQRRQLEFPVHAADELKMGLLRLLQLLLEGFLFCLRDDGAEAAASVRSAAVSRFFLNPSRTALDTRPPVSESFPVSADLPAKVTRRNRTGS